MAEYRLSVYPDAIPLPWESQVEQYPRLGAPGIEYFAGVVADDALPIDCLLWRDEDGLVRGILNHYAQDYPPWERKGNVNVFVDPERRRQGIATALVREAVRRWGPIDVEQQSYTLAGGALVQALIETWEV